MSLFEIDQCLVKLICFFLQNQFYNTTPYREIIEQDTLLELHLDLCKATLRFPKFFDDVISLIWGSANHPHPIFLTNLSLVTIVCDLDFLLSKVDKDIA